MAAGYNDTVPIVTTRTPYAELYLLSPGSFIVLGKPDPITEFVRIRCDYCKSKVDEDDKECPNCGAPL